MAAASWLERAHRTLASATLLLDDGADPDRACSTAYYAMFYAARAALIHVEQPQRALGKTHSGIVSAFSQFVAQPGLVAKQHGPSFSRELNRRLVADYDASGISSDAAKEALASAQAFVEAITELVRATENAGRQL